MNYRKFRIRTLGVVLALVTGIAACDSCQPKEVPPPVVEPVVEPKVEIPEVDPLEEARGVADKDAEGIAVVLNDTATLVASSIEAEANKPPEVVAKKPKSDPETGKIDTSAVKRIFDQNNTAMRKCYERVLKASPGLEGKVTLEVKIQSDGTVGSAKARGVSLDNAAINDCMERQAKSMKFPQPKGGSVRVANPYTFRPDF